jgi:thymidine kinase
MKFGLLTVNIGSMFSGKTEELLRQMRRAKIAGKTYKLFKPARDNRHEGVEVVSHGGDRLEAIVVKDAREIPKFVGPGDVVGIDEGQFFEEYLVPVVRTLKRQGSHVFVSGLDMKFNGTPFQVMAELSMIANKVKKFNAVCVHCGEDAYVSHRKVQGDEDILVGGAEAYIALCENCDYEAMRARCENESNQPLFRKRRT